MDPHSAAQPPARRDNGLPADRYVALADVDPRLGDHLLDLLRLAEIPAYLEPPADPRVAAAQYNISGPIERLYVESTLRAEAREVVVAAAAEAGPTDLTVGRAVAEERSSSNSAGHGPSLLDGVDTDAEFARIVASFSTDVEPRESDPVGDAGQAAPDAFGEVTAAMLDAAAAQRSAREDFEHDDESLEEHFEPPPPPRIPIPSAATLCALAIFVLGLFIIARGDLIGFGSDVSFPLGVVAVLAGLGLLVARLRPRPGLPDDSDDGAIV